MTTLKIIVLPALCQACVGSVAIAQTSTQLGLLSEDPRYTEAMAAVDAAANEQPPSGTKPRVVGPGALPTSLYPDVTLIVGAGVCTGTVVAPGYALTALHCVCDYIADAVSFGETPGAASAAGVVDQPIPNDQCPMAKGALDAAVLHFTLSNPAENPMPKPRRLATTALINAAKNGWVVGYGLNGGGGQGTKEMAPVPIVSPVCADPQDHTRYGCTANVQLVAGLNAAAVSNDTCNGDSGGPLLIADPSNPTDPKSDLIAAITVRAASATKKCGYGGIYNRVDGVLLEWLKGQHIPVTVFGG
jgi:hypothetical protein